MIIFALPLPYKGDVGRRQFNALMSWLTLGSASKIILFGADSYTKRTLKNYEKISFLPLKANKRGTPFISSAFEIKFCLRSTSSFKP